MKTGLGPDSVVMYMSGADVAGGYQMDAGESLGGYRSCGRVAPVGIHRFSPITNVEIEFVSGLNGTGLGKLESVGTGSLRWAAPGGVFGDAVAIANGERRVLCDGNDAGAFVIVRRNSTYELGGKETTQLFPVLNNVAGAGNWGVSDTGAHYRAVMVRNDGETAVSNLVCTIPVAYQGEVRLAVETPDGAGAIQTIADEETAPTSVSWQGVSVTVAATLNPGDEMGLWIERDRPGGVTPGELAGFEFTFTYDGVEYDGAFAGAVRRAVDLDPYLIWISKDSEPNLVSDTPDAAAALPVTLPGKITGEGDYYVSVVQRNDFGLVSPVYETVLHVDGDGTVSGPRPTGPVDVIAAAAADGKVSILAQYFALIEEVAANRATDWVIYLKAGSAPDPDVDSPAAVVVMGTRNIEFLNWTSTASWVEGTPVYALVRTRRGTIESLNTAAKMVTAAWYGPRRPLGTISYGSRFAQRQAGAEPDAGTVWIDEAKNVYWSVTGSYTALMAAGVEVWRITWEALETTFDLHEGTVSGAASSVIEFGTWDAGAKEIFVAVGDVRRMKIDVVAGTIEVGGVSQMTAFESSLSADPVYERYDGTCFQVWDRDFEDYKTAMRLDEDGALALGVDWRQSS